MKPLTSGAEVDDDDDDADSLPLRELRRLAGGRCADCARTYSAREAVFGVALGLKSAPRCLPCTARRLGRDEAHLNADLIDYVHRRECYLRAWREAERMDGVEADAIRTAAPAPPAVVSGPAVAPDDDWDAGDMGCGELVMALRIRMNKLPAGGVIRVRANDPAAPEDLPAWCRLCGHTLVAMDHPTYFIRRKET